MSWTADSALWQITHGDMHDARTRSAYRWLEKTAILGPAVSLDEVQALAVRLMNEIRTLRYRQVPQDQ